MTEVLRCRELTRHYRDGVALDGVALAVAEGEVHALVGLNGAGKTTLLRLCLGMLTPDSGDVTVFGESPRTASARVWRRVGHAIADRGPHPELTVAENLRCAALLHGVRSGTREAIERVVARFELQPWIGRRAGALSSGNARRLALAGALLHMPDLLVLDEPTNALDPVGIVMLRELLLELAGSGVAVLVSSHHLDEVARTAHRVTVMHAGRVVGALPTGEPDLERRFFETVHAAELVRR